MRAFGQFVDSTLTLELAGEVCQTDLGYAGPGLMRMQICGEPLGTGQSAELLVTRIAADRILVTTLKPLVVNAGALDLADEVEALREIAGLPSISKAVPVTFVLQFVAG